jgi:hypothetical protein
MPMPARFPSATASTTSRPPLVQSPPEKNFGYEVWPDGQHYQICREGKFRTWLRDDRSIRSSRQCDQLNTFDSVPAQDARGLRMPQELYSLKARVFVFKGECGHLLSTAAVDDVYIARAQPGRGNGGIDGSVAGADDHHTRGRRRACS